MFKGKRRVEETTNTPDSTRPVGRPAARVSIEKSPLSKPPRLTKIPRSLTTRQDRISMVMRTTDSIARRLQEPRKKLRSIITTIPQNQTTMEAPETSTISSLEGQLLLRPDSVRLVWTNLRRVLLPWDQQLLYRGKNSFFLPLFD